MIAVHIDLEVLALPRPLSGVGAEVPVAVQRVDGVLHALPQHSLASLVAEDVRGEKHLDTEHSLGRLGRRTRRVHEGLRGVVGWAPEAFGTASVELGDGFGESESRVARDLAHLELAPGTPVLAALGTTKRIGQRRAEFS